MTTDFLNLAQLGQEWLTFSLVFALQLLIVLALRKPVRAKLGAVACYRLWLLPLLWVPFYVLGPALFTALANFFAGSARDGGAYPPAFQQFMAIELLPFSVDLSGGSELSAGGSTAFQKWTLLALIQACGTLALIVWQGYRWLNFSRHVHTIAAPLSLLERQREGAASHFDANVPIVQLPGINSAALFGVFKPVLLLPQGFSERYDSSQRHIILAHEAVHMHRGDNTWNVLALLLIALFWTNPLVFIAWRYFRLDQELSCDALALSQCTREQQKRYARTLLDSLGMETLYKARPALTAWNNLDDIKERSLMIRQHLHTAARPVVTQVSLLIFAVAGASLTVTFAELASSDVQAAEPSTLEEQARQVQEQSELVEQQSRQLNQQAELVEQQARQVERQNQQVERQTLQTEEQSRVAAQQAQRVEQQARQAAEQAQQAEQQSRQAAEQAQQAEQQSRQAAEQAEQKARQGARAPQPQLQETRQIQQAQQAVQGEESGPQQGRQQDQESRPVSRTMRLQSSASRADREPSENELRDIDAQTGRILSRTIEFLNEEQFAEAREEIEKLHPERLSPFERSRYEQLMFNLEMNAGNYPAARARLQGAIDSGGLNEDEISTVRYQIAQLFVQEENYTDAAAALEAWIAAEAKPKPAAHYLLAAAYYYQQQFDKALPNAQLAVDLGGDAPQEGWLSMLASLNIQRDDYAAATPVLDRMVHMFPTKKTYWEQLTGLYLQQEQYDNAESVLAEMVERFPDEERYRTQFDQLQSLNVRQ